MFTAKISFKREHGLEMYTATVYYSNGSVAGHTKAHSKEGARTQAQQLVNRLKRGK